MVSGCCGGGHRSYSRGGGLVEAVETEVENGGGEFDNYTLNVWYGVLVWYL